MVATVIFYVFLRTVGHNVIQISILGHAWRLGFMLLIGSVLGAAVAQLTGTTNRELPPAAV